MFLHRGPNETWRYEFWAVLPVPDKGRRKYRLGTALVEVQRHERLSMADEQAMCPMPS